MDEISPERARAPIPGGRIQPGGKRGELKIFLGIGPGAGKTAAMLRAALAHRLTGRHVLIGIARAHGVREVEALAGRMPGLSSMSPTEEGLAEEELDCDEVLTQKPDLVVVDELAHVNRPGARHPQRFQDVIELIEAGIDVYTTLNVYEIASRADLLGSAAASHGVLPDSIVDNAEIELVDLPPVELIRRFRFGHIRLPENFEPAKARFFEPGNLMALREAAARLFAGRVAREAQNHRQNANLHEPAGLGHRVLLAVDSDSDAEHLILFTRRMAESLHAQWVVLYVESPGEARFADESRLTRSLDMARSLGAEVITTTDDDFADAVLRVASARNVTQIVAGKSPSSPWWQPFPRDSRVARLIRGSGSMGVHVAPERRGGRIEPPQRRLAGASWAQYLVVVGAIGLVTWAGFLFTPLVGAHATALLSLLAIVVLALFVDRGPTLLAAAMSAAIWDYFFLPPEFAFRVSHLEDGILLVMYFVVALALGQLTARLRAQEAGERQRERRATALYLLTRELADATHSSQIVRAVVAEVGRSLDAEVAVLLPDPAGRLQPQPAGSLELGEREMAAAGWAMERGQAAGKFTENLPSAEARLVPLNCGSGALGVIALRLRQSAPPTLHQQNLLDALTRQIALALDRQRLSELSKHIDLLAESERLGKTLLDSMSHEIRTPVAAITTAVSDLAELGPVSAPGATLIEEIQQATERLNRLIGKVLDITRLESGHVKPLFNECVVADIVNLAVAETEKELARHKVTVEISPRLPIIRTDFVFLQQALMNLLSNAAFHTPAGTAVQLRVWTNAKSLLLSVADRGPGLDPQSISRVFDKFHRGPAAPAGGTGLGLSLVKSFIEALGGTVKAGNRAGGGAEFTITLPLAGTESQMSVAI